MFTRLIKAMGKHDAYGLDYISVYGGYVIVEYGPNGIESHPFGLMRRNAREMYLSMLMASQALENANK